MFKAAMSVFVLLTIALLLSSPAASTQTRLPDRIVHRESGITLVLVPAGNFWSRTALILYAASPDFKEDTTGAASDEAAA